jgi:uncharacterized membrane protein
MTWYTFFKSVHVLCAVIWVGGAFVSQFYARLALASPDRSRQATFAKDVEWIGLRIFTTSSLLVFLSGVAATQNAHWPWGSNWITFGLIVFGASFVSGAGFLGPESGRLSKLIAAEGPESPAVTARIRRILLVSRIELVLLIAVIWNMVVKPVGQPGWFWGALAVTAVAIAVVVATYLRGAPTVAGEPATE